MNNKYVSIVGLTHFSLVCLVIGYSLWLRYHCMPSPTHQTSPDLFALIEWFMILNVLLILTLSMYCAVKITGIWRWVLVLLSLIGILFFFYNGYICGYSMRSASFYFMLPSIVTYGIVNMSPHKSWLLLSIVLLFVAWHFTPI
jgi:hypothetical protein